MRGHWRRVLVLAAVCPLALVLTGCNVTGSVDVRSGTEVVADLIFTDAAVDCLGLTEFAGLRIKGTPDSGGNQRCRAQGTIELDELRQFGIQVAQAGEYLVVDVAMPQSLGYTPLEVDIRFPGPVTEPGETVVTGNQVRLRTGAGIATTSPTRIVAMAHAGPEWWIVGAVAGFVAGVGLTLSAVWTVRRRRRATLPDLTADGTGTDDPGEAHDSGDVPENQGPESAEEFWKDPTPVRDPAYEALFAPPVAPDAAAPARQTTADAAASTRVQDAAPVPVPDARAPDHSIWGPPEDRADR